MPKVQSCNKEHFERRINRPQPTMTDKLKLGEGSIKGGLTGVQRYQVNILLPEKNLSPKVELALILPRRGEDKHEYRSLRFTHPGPLIDCISELAVAFILLTEMNTLPDDPIDFREKLKGTVLHEISNALKNHKKLGAIQDLKTWMRVNGQGNGIDTRDKEQSE